MFFILRIDASNKVSILKCAESHVCAMASLRTSANELIMDKCGKEHLRIAYCSDADSHSAFREGFFLVPDGDTLCVYKKEQHVNSGYISSTVEAVVTNEGSFRIVEAESMTCREKTDGEYVCDRCGHRETHYVTTPTNVDQGAQNLFFNVMSELSNKTDKR